MSTHRLLLRKIIQTSTLVFLVALGVSQNAQAANIVWVSDYNDTAVGFFPPGSDFTDSGYVTLLQNAGHNVIRYNQPNAQGTLLTPAELAALNTNDLVIISRAVNSGAFQPGQGNQWNTNITKPLIDLSPFHVRTGSSRLGWLAGAEGPDDIPTALSAVLTGDPVRDAVVDYIFGGVNMNGTNTAQPYDEIMDRNTSQIPGAPPAGGVIYATATYAREDGNATPATGNVIVGLPAGTAVRGGADILSGYRMFFSTGSRESALAPNAIPIYTGRENLTPAGEDIFLRSVQVAINNGIAPLSDPLAPIEFTSQPASTTVVEGSAVTFSVTVTGAPPRTIQWQRGPGDGSFADIPGASTVFSRSTYRLPSVSTADDGAQFRVVATNPFGTVTSDVATLTVTKDTVLPTVVSIGSLDGMNIGVCFSEVLDNSAGTVTDLFNYHLNDDTSPLITAITVRPDGRSVNLALSGPLDRTFKLTIESLYDLHNNQIESTTLFGTNLGLTTVDVGALSPTGTNYTCVLNSFQVSGSGTNVTGSADMLRYVYQTISGDFDARVRVTSLVGTADHLESTAKALLDVRESAANNSAHIGVYITPSRPGDNTVGVTVRTNTAGPSGELGLISVPAGTLPNPSPNGLPNAWLRIRRVGNVFTASRSLNGTDWSQLASLTLNYTPSVTVGVGVNSHRVGKLATGTFNDFRVISLPVRLLNPAYNSGTFSAGIQTQQGIGYVIQYKDALDSRPWTTLTTLTGDGTYQTFSDSSASTTGNRFYEAFIP